MVTILTGTERKRRIGTPENPVYRTIPVGALRNKPPGEYTIRMVEVVEGYDERGSFEIRQYMALEDDDSWKHSSSDNLG